MTKSFGRRLAIMTIAAFALLGTLWQTIRSAEAQVLTERPTVASLLRAAFESPSTGIFNPKHRDVLNAFYAGRDFEPVWVDVRGPTRAATQVLRVLEDAALWGLNAGDFKLTANRAPKMLGTWTADQAAAADIEISQLVIEYALQARGSRIPEPDTMLSTYLDRRPNLPDAATVLSDVSRAASPNALLLSYHPQHDQFQKLQHAYAALAANGAPAAAIGVPRDGPLIMPGNAHPDVRALRARLKVPADDANAASYDAPLVAAVKRFQQNVGLTADGYIGSKTRRALSSAESPKLDVIRANMEQWRWMPEDLGGNYLFVNIPAFTVEHVRNGEVLSTERVIVGKNDTQTPVFSKSLSTVVLRPEWFLPDSIKLEKLLSSQRRGGNIESQGYVIRKGNKVVPSWKVNWAKANISHYEFFQPSGDGNALGDVKFLFPNKHSVYLHDTPSKSLFDANERLFSHGCIRLKNPLTLAQTLLDDDKGPKKFDVKTLVRRGPGGNAITLDSPVPVHVAYFTAWAESDGAVKIYPDYYSHEQRIKLALDNKWKDIDKGADHLAAVDTVQLKTVRVFQRPAFGPDGLPLPLGVTKSKSSFSFFGSGSSSSGSSRDRHSVGEIMRNALDNRN